MIKKQRWGGPKRIAEEQGVVRGFYSQRQRRGEAGGGAGHRDTNDPPCHIEIERGGGIVAREGPGGGYPSVKALCGGGSGSEVTHSPDVLFQIAHCRWQNGEAVYVPCANEADIRILEERNIWNRIPRLAPSSRVTAFSVYWG